MAAPRLPVHELHGPLARGRVRCICGIGRDARRDRDQSHRGLERDRWVLPGVQGRARDRRAPLDDRAARASVRDGAAQIIPAREVVAGDRLLLRRGPRRRRRATGGSQRASDQRGAADRRERAGREVARSIARGAPLAERHESVFLGTAVAAGSGAAEVVATGMATEMGKIANLLAGAESEETPLQRRLGQSGRMLVILCLGVVIVVAILGILRRDPWLDVLVSSVSLAVAAVPEGLPAIVTVALAIGVQRMAARNVMVRRLHSVETLGCATVICTDKTGTLTRGVMAVRDVWARDRRALLDAAAACSKPNYPPTASRAPAIPQKWRCSSRRRSWGSRAARSSASGRACECGRSARSGAGCRSPAPTEPSI